jgi:hypothetical protein
MTKEYETLYNTKYPYKNSFEMCNFYNFLHLLRKGKRVVGAIGVRRLDAENVSADILFKDGCMDIEFIRDHMEQYSGLNCLVTIKKTDLPTRTLASNLGFNIVNEDDELYLYKKYL